MRRRMKLRQNYFLNISLRNKIGLIFLLVLVGVVYVFFLLNKRVTPVLLNYAELETTKLTTLIINKAVQSQVSKNIKIDDMVKTTLNNMGEIIAVDFDTTLINQSLSMINNAVGANLKLLEDGKFELLDLPEESIYKSENVGSTIVYYIPFGVITDIPIIADIGPKIPVKTSMVGSVVSNVKTDIQNYGINNALVKVYIRVVVSEQVILPFISKRINTSLDIPILIKVIQGKVPQVYGGMYSVNSPSVSNGS